MIMREFPFKIVYEAEVTFKVFYKFLQDYFSNWAGYIFKVF